LYSKDKFNDVLRPCTYTLITRQIWGTLLMFRVNEIVICLQTLYISHLGGINHTVLLFLDQSTYPVLVRTV
jgi:hypothetical protein